MIPAKSMCFQVDFVRFDAANTTIIIRILIHRVKLVSIKNKTTKRDHDEVLCVKYYNGKTIIDIMNGV